MNEISFDHYNCFWCETFCFHLLYNIWSPLSKSFSSFLSLPLAVIVGRIVISTETPNLPVIIHSDIGAACCWRCNSPKWNVNEMPFHRRHVKWATRWKARIKRKKRQENGYDRIHSTCSIEYGRQYHKGSYY